MQRLVNVLKFMFGSMLNIAIALVIIIASYFAIVWAFDWGQNLLAGDDSYYMEIDGEQILVEFEIPEDATGMEIAQILRENGLINNEFLFYLQARLNGSYRHFRSGTHSIPLGASENLIMYLLPQIPETQAEHYSITIIEGRNNFQIAEIAGTLGYFSTDEFLYVLENTPFSFGFLQSINPENNFAGFLFPDTYILPNNPTPADIIIRMLNRFEDIFTPQMYARLQFELPYEIGLNLSLEELIIVAAIIELEARNPDDRPLMAAFIYNRLRAGMPLEVPTALSFTLNRRLDMLTPADFNINSAYNTFNRAGLPPSAIANPGLNSILAALNPANVGYLYRAISNEETGSLHFSNTPVEIQNENDY